MKISTLEPQDAPRVLGVFKAFVVAQTHHNAAVFSNWSDLEAISSAWLGWQEVQTNAARARARVSDLAKDDLREWIAAAEQREAECFRHAVAILRNLLFVETDE